VSDTQHLLERPQRQARAGGGVPIVLDDVTKTYPDARGAAVDHLSMEIPAGEIVVLVGPSGCGKTTTMRMINRLIEPTSGRITIDGRDAQSLDDVKLRRTIGYVIQQIGLFPHLSIAQNIALVPKMLGHDKGQIRERVDEMLDLVGLDPAEYRQRYPRQLSGGQQQRVGVARALAADPPIMLMDEPIGAVDPITRTRLQDEFLAVQEGLGKTIVFVTHDFDEAIKMGDRIAILRSGSKIAQYDTPQAILTNPADEFVEGFIGRGATLKRLALERIGDLQLRPVSQAGTSPTTIEVTASLHDALDMMLGEDDEALAVVRRGQRVGSISFDDVLKRVRELREESARAPQGGEVRS
jgi:osmoprotectant transport system ATP-binding protein